MTTYAKAVDGGEVEHFEDADESPGAGFIEVVGGWPLPPRPNAPARHFITDGVVRWDDPRDLAATASAAIRKTYADVNSVYEDAVGQRTPEYTTAEEEARAYKAAGFPADMVVSEYITGHARSNPTLIEQTNPWAAQQIIERADAFKWAKLNLRVVRGDRQKEMRLAATLGELDAAISAWNRFIAWMRVQLGV